MKRGTENKATQKVRLGYYMWVINKRTGETIADKAIIASTFLGRLQGLMGKKELLPGTALVLHPCRSIHTFFMRFPIDVVFLNKEGMVVFLISELSPYRVSPYISKAETVIELPPGTIEKEIQSGDFLLIAR
jgi:uncharacterized membrane protein (UPF0127 family)